MKAVALLLLQGNADVVEHAQFREHRRDLERSHHALAGNRRRLHPGDVFTVEINATGGRWQVFGQQVEHRGLACAVGSDQGVNVAAVDIEVDLVHSGKALELAGQVAGLQYQVGHCCSVSSVIFIAVPAFRWLGLSP